MRRLVRTSCAGISMKALRNVRNSMLSTASFSCRRRRSHRPLSGSSNANQAFSDHANAATAYELLLDRYPTGHSAAEVRLILGLLYARQLDRPQRAQELIEQARSRLTDTDQVALAEQLLAELSG